MATISALKEQRDAFGPLVVLDYSGYGFTEAHRALGAEVRAQVEKILVDKINSLDPLELANKIRQARACWELLESKSRQAGLDLVIRQAIEEYLACLRAWTQGVGLAEFEHTGLLQVLDGRMITGLDLAWLLQHDNVGCQTGMYRCEGGGVIFWHAEEDVATPGERFDKIRIAKLTLSDGNTRLEIQAFIYPDLLPGPAFAWRSDGYAQAADTLVLLSLPEYKQAALVNVVSWLALRLGSQVELEKIVQALSPYWDGYALNTTFIRNEAVYGVKCEFARDQIVSSHLAETIGGFLFQVNVFCNRRSRMLQVIEALPLDRRRYHATRLYRTRRMLGRKSLFKPKGEHLESERIMMAFDYPSKSGEQYGSILPPDEIEYFYHFLGSRAGGDAAYANLDVRAWFLACLSPLGMSVRVGPGAVIDT